MKGSASMGRKNKGTSHRRCRRCGHHSYNVRKGYCSYCGFGKSTTLREYEWSNNN